MGVDRFHTVCLFLSSPCTLSKEAFVYFVCPTEIPQPPFAWKYYPDDPYYRLGPVHTCLYVRVRETCDWDLSLARSPEMGEGGDW